MASQLIVTVAKVGDYFEANPTNMPGSPMVGRGKTTDEALGDFFRSYQKEFGVMIVLDPSAWAAERRRQKRELSKR